jgi:hypothetical protein
VFLTLQVRKKSAKLMEMEESDRLEKVLYNQEKKGTKGGGRKSRSGLPEYTIDETLRMTNVDVYQPQMEEKPIKVRFSLGSNLDSQDSSVRSGSKKDRKKGRFDDVGAADDADYDSKLVIDEPVGIPRGQSYDGPLRMKLTMTAPTTAAFAGSDSVSFGHLEGLSSSVC